MAEREHDSICDQISRDGRAEIDRLREIISEFQNSTRIQKEYAADQEDTIENLTKQREEAAKRILSLEDSYSEKCVELDAMSWEVDAGRSVKAAVVELSQLLKEVLLGTDGARAKNLFAPETFQPKRPEEQPQKPMCDN